MIDLKKIELYLGKEKPKLIIDELSINEGLWALVGRNGVGKSTFLNALTNIEYSYASNIEICNKKLSNYKAKELAKKIAVVFSKSNVFGNLTALDVLFLGRIPYQGLITKKTKLDIEKVHEIISLLNLNNYLQKQFNVLSDGEKQLIMIGRALVQDTPIILLDEPTAFLDVVNRKYMVNVLNNIVKSQSKLILFSTHNINIIEQFCSGVLFIKDNKLKKIVDLENINNKLEALLNNEI